METLLSFLPLLKVLASFACMLTCIRLRLGIGLSILTGSLAVALLFDMPMLELARAAGQGLLQEKALYLCAILGLIMAMSTVLEQTGQTERLLSALGRKLRIRRLKIVFFPALIGLLPMPGGAVFSAPLTKSAAAGLDVPPLTLARINYWFRHIWEMAWPLYPGIILTSSLSGIPISRLSLLLLPGVVACMLLGWIFLLRPKVLRLPEKTGHLPMADTDENKESVLWLGLPFLIAIGGAVAMEVTVLTFLPSIAFELGMCVALFLAALVAALQNENGLAITARVITSRKLWAMILIIAAVFIYQETLSRSGAVRAMAAMSGPGALAAVALLLPFVVGLVSGISVAYVGATFPLLLGMITQSGLEQHMEAYVVLGAFAGFSGIMISPIHICLMLTCQYFNTDLVVTWRRLAVMSLLLAGCGALWFSVLL